MRRKVVLVNLYEDVSEKAGDYSSDYSNGRIPRPSQAIMDGVLKILESDQLVHGLAVLREKLHKRDIAEAIQALEFPVNEGHFDFDKPAVLPSFNRDTDLNDEFRKLYWAVTDERRKGGRRPNAFAHTAALIRGTALEYHRRAAPRARRTS